MDSKTLPYSTVSTICSSNFIRGNKFFELGNHLGNVLVTISDKKIGVDDGTYDAVTGIKSNGTLEGKIDFYTADVVTANDYYPFGMGMPGRKFNAGSGYRYGFNGQEHSDDVINGNYTAEFWEYDARVARRWNIDPVVKEYESPYAVFGNNPIWNVDVDGADTAKFLTNGQLVDALKIASKEIKSRLNGGQGFGLQTKNYLPALNAATTAYALQHKLNTKQVFEFYSNVLENYNGLAAVAMVSSDGFTKLDRSVINNPGVNNYNTLRLSQGYMKESSDNLLGIITIGANVALGEAAGAIGTPVGAGPRGVFKSNTQQRVVIAAKVTELENKGLNKFFSDNTTKIKVTIDKKLYVTTQKNAEFVNPPSCLTREALLKYKNIAQRAINGSKGDGVGAQKVRIELIDQALKNMK